MKTITLEGEQHKFEYLYKNINLQDKDKNLIPYEVETRVYVVDTHSLHSTPHWKVSQEDFMMLAEKQGTVYTLQGFQEDFNIGKYETHYVIRFINVLISENKK